MGISLVVMSVGEDVGTAEDNVSASVVAGNESGTSVVVDSMGASLVVGECVSKSLVVYSVGRRRCGFIKSGI